MSHVDDGTLHAYLDGELSPPEAQGVDAHLAQCPACRTRLEEERALITRAGELLARAAPPDRELPPFRPGDVKPPVRLWWHVRTPVAWAATIALALGIGTYVGEHGAVPFERPTDVTGDVAQNASAPAVVHALKSVATERQQDLPERRVRAAKRAASPAVGSVAEEKSKQEALAQAAPDSTARRDAAPLAVVSDGYLASKAAAPAPAHRDMVQLGAYGGAAKGPPISVDSARLLLGSDPMAVPDLPIRGIYRARMIGYTGLVIVEQALDSSTVIEVLSGHLAPMELNEVVVTGAAAARPDSQSPRARGLLNARQADSLAADQEKATRGASGLFVDVRGPVSPDSLAALKRLVRPLRP